MIPTKRISVLVLQYRHKQFACVCKAAYRRDVNSYFSKLITPKRNLGKTSPGTKCPEPLPLRVGFLECLQLIGRKSFPSFRQLVGGGMRYSQTERLRVFCLQEESEFRSEALFDFLEPSA